MIAAVAVLNGKVGVWVTVFGAMVAASVSLGEVLRRDSVSQGSEPSGEERAIVPSQRGEEIAVVQIDVMLGDSPSSSEIEIDSSHRVGEPEDAETPSG